MVKKKARKTTGKSAKKVTRLISRETPLQKINALIQEFSELPAAKHEKALIEMEKRAGDALNALEGDAEEDVEDVEEEDDGEDRDESED